MSEENKAIARQLFEEVIDKGKLELADKLFADSYVDHLPSTWGEWKGAEGVKKFTTNLRTAFPDARHQIDDIIAEGDRVVIRFAFTGTNLGQLGAMAPTGTKVKFTGVTIFRCESGKVVEVWANVDDLALMQQLGVVTDPAVTEANEAAVRRCIEEILNQGNLALVDELFTSASNYHGPNIPKLLGREARKQHYAAFLRAFPDGHFTTDELIAEKDKVVLRWFFAGTHKGEFLGAVPTGRKVACSGTSTFQLAGGMIADEFVQFDTLGFMQQLGAVPASTEANKALVRRYIEEIANQGNLELVDELFSADSISQGANHPEIRGREARKQHNASARKAFPDFHCTLNELIAEGDKVVGRWTDTGTHLGEFWGAAPTGKKITFSGTSTLKIVEGKIAEELLDWDALGFMQQLGAVPASTEANKAVVRRHVEEALNQGRFALMDELYSADVIYHGPSLPELRGREALKQHFASLRRGFPDLYFTVDQLIAQGDKVVLGWSATGTHQGEWLGLAPSGKKISVSGTTTLTFGIKDGMITDESVQWDALGIMQQLGVVRAINQSAGAAR